MPEFDLIRDHLCGLGSRRADVALGVGDDCALVRVPHHTELALSMDTLVAGVHFFPDCDPEGLGHKALAVSLSDLAAMGAQPAWTTLALTLPQADAGWLRAFTRGFGQLAAAHGVELVGGDTTRGPLAVTVQVQGYVPKGSGVRRSGARPGDLVCVSGALGDAGLALRLLGLGESVPAILRDRLERPSPRVDLGIELRGIASAMIDLSDGLAADLGHILAASGVGAEVLLSELPLSTQVREWLTRDADWGLPVTAGDDYELCFCIPEQYRGCLQDISRRCGTPLQAIGQIRREAGLSFLLEDGSRWTPDRMGFDHFADAS